MAKMIKISEARALYALPLDEEQLKGELLIIEHEGRPLAALVPIDEYNKFIAWREQVERQEQLRALEEERAAFLRLRDELLKTYKDLFVAIHGGQVVDYDADNLALAQRMYAQGYRPVYIQRVSEEPRTVELPSPEVVRHVPL